MGMYFRVRTPGGATKLVPFVDSAYGKQMLGIEREQHKAKKQAARMEAAEQAHQEEKLAQVKEAAARQLRIKQLEGMGGRGAKEIERLNAGGSLIETAAEKEAKYQQERMTKLQRTVSAVGATQQAKSDKERLKRLQQSRKARTV